MKCPKCSFEQPAQNVECIHCGLIFEKYKRRHSAPSVSKSLTMAQAEFATDAGGIIKNLFFFVKPETNPLIFGARVLLFLIILVWGLIFIFSAMESNTIGNSFWHLVNLPFHEAGHIIFRPLGRFMMMPDHGRCLFWVAIRGGRHLTDFMTGSLYYENRA
jgi:hypothetical protein